MADIEVTVPAESRALLTLEELRAAAGDAVITDEDLEAAGLAVADIIALYCGVVDDGEHPATFVQETLLESFFPARRGARLELARRFVEVGSVVENGVTLTAGTDYRVDRSAGVLRRLISGFPACWPELAIMVTYTAGFATAPTPLKDVAAEMVARRVGAARDPMMKRERIDIPGVRETEREYWVDAATNTDITPDMAQKLDAYRTRGM